MAELIFITGGARSGKSRFAENLLASTAQVVYIATALANDVEMKERIQLHRERRNPQWSTVEAYASLGDILLPFAAAKEAALLDCLTLMICNLMLKDASVDWDKIALQAVDRIERQIEREVDSMLNVMRNFKGQALVVSNEVGMGLVPEYPLGRYFRDIAGRMNQKTAALADKVYLMVSGIPVKIKG